MGFYTKDSDGVLVPIQEDIPAEAIAILERADDEAIVRRLSTGIASEEFIYRYTIQTKTGPKEIIGISSDGSHEVANMIRNLEVLNDARVDKDSDPDYIYGMVRVKNLLTNVIFLGVARQCKWMVDKGNVPVQGRLNEHAFVAAISKAQRNGILHHVSEELILKIIQAFDKSGKSRKLAPPKLETEEAVSPALKPTDVSADQIAQQQEKLKKLRMDVHNRFQTDLGIGLEKRKQMLGERFPGVSSLTELNETQLKECLSWTEELIQAKSKTAAHVSAAPAILTPESLGFSSLQEQNELRGRLYTMLTVPEQLALNADEVKLFMANRKYTKSTEIPKAELLKIIQEVEILIKAKQTPVPEMPTTDIPF